VTTAALSPLRKQGDVSKDSTAPTAVLPQGSSAPPTATTSHEQGAKISPAVTTACTLGTSSSLLDTLAPCYISYCTPGPSPYAYKKKVQGTRTRRLAARGNGTARISLSLSPTRTLVTPYCKRTRPGRGTNTKAAGFPFTPVSLWFPPFVLRLALTHLGWDTRRQFTRRSRDPRGRNADTYLGVRTRGKLIGVREGVLLASVALMIVEFLGSNTNDLESSTSKRT
jgi:hypothetical protein